MVIWVYHVKLKKITYIDIDGTLWCCRQNQLSYIRLKAMPVILRAVNTIPGFYTANHWQHR
jgi:hypothetical protein